MSVTYPLAISQDDRNTISGLVNAVTTAEALLLIEIAQVQANTAGTTAQSNAQTYTNGVQAAINQYIAGQLATANADLTAFQSQVNTMLSGTSITYAQAQALVTALATVVSGATTLESDATALGVDSTAFATSVSTLQSTLNPYITQASGNYPLTITSGQNASITAAFQAQTAAQTALTNAINAANTSTQLTNGINTVNANLVEAFKEADLALDDTWMSQVANASVVWQSPTAIGLQSQQAGKVGAIWVNGQLVVDDELGSGSVIVHNTDPVIDWDGTSLSTLSVAASTSYYIYLANSISSSFNIGGRDARGKLFLSLTPDVNGYLGSGIAANARIVGQIDTDGAGLFLNDLGINWNANSPNITDTYREYCDFYLSYVDENTLALQLVDGLAGDIYIAGQLLRFGDNITATTTMPRVNWVSNAPVLDQTAISANTQYYLYVTNGADSWNFNAINATTGLPWQESDVNASGNYNATLDKRQDLVLSTKAEEHMVMSGVYPGYMARFLGYVTTDANGKFIYTSDMSAIRSLQLNPTYLAGLADIEFQNVSTTEFKVIRKRGSSGMVMVGQTAIPTFDSDNPSVHTVTTSDTLYDYTESNPTSPLSASSTSFNQLIQQECYLYLANNNLCWGGLAGRTFLSTHVPSDAYLSRNYPGNNARWLATISLAPGIAGAELTTNGQFASDMSSWSGSPQWAWVSTNQNVKYTYATTGTTTVVVGTPTSCSGWTALNSAVITQQLCTVTPGAIYHAISFDSDVTWKVFVSSAWLPIAKNNAGTWQYWTGSAWTNASSNTQAQALSQATGVTGNQWTVTAIQAMTSGNWSATGGWSTSVTAINWAVSVTSGTNYIADGTTNTSPTSAVPSGMTANSTTIGGITYVTSADTIYNSSYDAWKAFNKNAGDNWSASATACPHWLVFDLGSGNAQRINTFNYYGQSGYSPKRWIFQGSNDNATWANLLDNSGADVADPGNAWTPLFPFVNGVAYRYYRLYITATYISSGNVSIQELFLGLALTQSASPAFTSANLTYTNPTIQNLSQSISVTAGATYQVQFTTSGVGAGSVTPQIGGTLGTAVSAAQLNTQYILATNTGALNFIPTTNFNGSIDNVSVTQITSGAMAGSYMIDSIAPTIPVIDNTVVGTNVLWDSQQIMSLYNNLFSRINVSNTFASEQSSGLNIILEYVDTTHIRLRALNQDMSIILPDLSAITVSVTGIQASVSGAVSTFYYVYLSSAGLSISTSAPTSLYYRLSIYGSSYILVGYLGFSATNSMEGKWCVYSLYNQQCDSWSIGIPTDGTTIANSWRGFVVPPGKNISITRSGQSSYSGSIQAINQWGLVNPSIGIALNPISIGSYTNIYGGIWSGWGSYTGVVLPDPPGGYTWFNYTGSWPDVMWGGGGPYINVSVALDSTTPSGVGTMSVSLTHSSSGDTGRFYWTGVVGFQWAGHSWSCTGQINVSRPASNW